MEKRLGSACAALTIAFVVAAISPLGYAADFRWLNSFDRIQPQIPEFVEPFQKGVEAASKGSIKFIISGPETVPAFEQLQPAASGAFQFLFTHGAYHFGTMPILAALEALGGTPEQRKASGVIDVVDAIYNKLGLKLISLAQTPEGGYQIILRKPPTPAGDLEGFKIRGNPTYQPVLKMLGAAMVSLPPSEVYTALDKGVVDGFAYTGFGVVAARLNEPAKYVLRPGFGFASNPILVNLNTWNRFSAAEKKILYDEAAKAEVQWLKASAQLIAQEEKDLISKGLQVVQMGDAQKAKLKRVWSEGLWELAAQKHKKEVDEVRALARARGLD